MNKSALLLFANGILFWKTHLSRVHVIIFWPWEKYNVLFGKTSYPYSGPFIKNSFAVWSFIGI